MAARVAVTHSPEPFSNMALSLGEDTTVIFLTWLATRHPYAAATIVGNAVDLPGHPAITRRPATDIDPDSDLGDRLVTWDVGPLDPAEIDAALDAGRRAADALLRRGLILGAVLALRGRFAVAIPPQRNAA